MNYRGSIPRLLVAFVVALPAVMAGPATSAQAAPNTRHCVQQAVPANSKHQAAPPTCYATFAEAIAQATGGAVRLPANVTMVTQEQLDAGYQARQANGQVALAAATIIIGISYQNTSWSGGSVTHTASANCDRTTWKIANVGSGWNDQFGSAKHYSGCTGNYYEHASFGGAWVQTWWSGGAMNDRTTSIRWN
jgi:hypothetical protein